MARAAFLDLDFDAISLIIAAQHIARTCRRPARASPGGCQRGCQGLISELVATSPCKAGPA